MMRYRDLLLIFRTSLGEVKKSVFKIMAVSLVAVFATIGILAVSVVFNDLHAKDSERTKVVVGDTVSFAHLGLYVGIRNGFFDKQGLDVERVVMPAGAKVLATLLSGDIDVGYFAAVSALQAQILGRPIKIVGASHNMEIYTLIGRSDLEGSVSKAEDLKGRTVGITSAGSGSWAFANLIAERSNMDAKEDFSIVPVGNMSALISALKTKRVDTITLWEPGTTMVLNENVGYPIIDLLDPKQHEEFLSEKKSLVEVIAASTETITNRSDTMRRFFTAQNEAYEWIHSHTVDEIAEVVAPVVGVADMQILKQALQRMISGVPEIATIDEALFAPTMQRLVDSGVLEEAKSFSDAVDNSYSGAK